ncbi:MAG TPA: methyltransferase domain-containing protein [Allosphingosinicella sp.]|nr:methyltransferase domain-containing protein [Allosphingosinicella sp.]
MTDTIEWQGRVGEAWAEEWRRTDRTLGPLNDALVARALPFAPRRILDIGCGAGATSLALAGALPEATVTGLDLSDALIAAARERAGDRSGLRFETGDAASWRPASGAFDLLVSRHGVMFFDDAEGAFVHLHSLVAADGRLLFSCFRARGENGWIVALRPVLERFAPDTLGAPEPLVGPFAFADPARIQAVLGAAGFGPPRIEPLAFDFAAGAGEDPVADAVHYFARIGPIARLLTGLDEDARRQALEQIAGIAAAHRDGERVVFPAAAWIVACASA